MCVSNFQLHLFTNVLKFWCAIQTFVLLAREDSSFSRRISLFYSQLLNIYGVFFFLQLETNFSVSCLEVQNILIHWVRLRIFLVLFYFHRGSKKRKDDYRYLCQWIIEIFIITQPYKLCTKRETKVGIVSLFVQLAPHLCTFISGLWLNSFSRVLSTSLTWFITAVNSDFYAWPVIRFIFPLLPIGVEVKYWQL